MSTHRDSYEKIENASIIQFSRHANASVSSKEIYRLICKSQPFNLKRHLSREIKLTDDQINRQRDR